jgi:hypothetical protein
MPASITPITPELPPVLRLLAHAVDFVQARELTAALPAARAMLASVPAHVTDDDGDHLNVSLEQFVDEQARTGPYAKEYSVLKSKTQSDQDLSVAFNVYTEPAVALGVAIAYVLLMDRGGVR